MSGDVQPRKRKDKKKKKDELSSTEELRGTAAAFGEGDVLMHSQQEHGTGGHWCAKIIFFSLLAVLIGLIGLIILENRGLSDLEANSVESRYTGVLDGWLEDAPDDHHDAHTLELKHPDEEEHDDTESSLEGERDVDLEDIEHEPLDEEPHSAQAQLSGELSDHDDDDDDQPGEEDDDDDLEEHDEDEVDQSDEAAGAESDEGDDDFLQHDDDDEDDVNEAEDQDDDGEDDREQDGEDENVSAPASAEAPYEEVEESSERLPADSLLEEQEYEEEQERQRQQAEAAGHKEGSNTMMRDDEWPDEPSEEHWRRELDLAEEEMHRGLLD